MKQNLGELTPVEGSLYVDSRGRKILVDKATKKAYIIKKEQVNKSGFYANRYVMAVILTGFFGFYFNWIWGIIAGLALAIVLELFYRKGFLTSLEEVDGFEMKAAPKREEVYAKLGKKENVIKLVCGIVLPLLLVVYVLMTIANSETVLTTNNIILFVFSGAASIYAIYIAVVTCKALAIIKKEEK